MLAWLFRRLAGADALQAEVAQALRADALEPCYSSLESRHNSTPSWRLMRRARLWRAMSLVTLVSLARQRGYNAARAFYLQHPGGLESRRGRLHLSPVVRVSDSHMLRAPKPGDI